MVSKTYELLVVALILAFSLFIAIPFLVLWALQQFGIAIGISIWTIIAFWIVVGILKFIFSKS